MPLLFNPSIYTTSCLRACLTFECLYRREYRISANIPLDRSDDTLTAVVDVPKVMDLGGINLFDDKRHLSKLVLT